MAFTLGDLLDRLPHDWGAPLVHSASLNTIEVTGIAEDSRRARPGTFFVAHAGRGSDGHRFIAAAIAAGATAIAGELPVEDLPKPLPDDIPYWQVADGRQTFALLSAAFFDFPSHKMIVVGVTGTDGKTTTSTLVHSILSAHGLRTGLISTIAARIGAKRLDTGFHVTTPEAFDLQGYLAQMVEAGCQAAVIETTSHALDQARVAQIDYDVAAVTNVTHEHLDWHGSWENYLAAKARLFQSLETSARKLGVSKTAVLNLDDQSYPTLATCWAERTVTYTLGEQAATCHARDIRVGRDGTRFALITPGGEIPIHLRLYGRYNVANALAAAGVGLALGTPLPAIAKGLNAVKRIRGRMEWVYSGAFDVVVDFAHTPHALEETIQLARDLRGKHGRVVLVFGSGGLRDVEKRAMMGRIACAADFSVITAEDPRTEDVNDIIEEIANGFAAGGGVEGVNFIRVPDRAEAISTAIQRARAGDIVVTCGKAHEKSMCYGTTETPWDEFAQIRKALRKRGLLASPGAKSQPVAQANAGTNSNRPTTKRARSAR